MPEITTFIAWPETCFNAVLESLAETERTTFTLCCPREAMLFLTLLLSACADPSAESSAERSMPAFQEAAVSAIAEVATVSPSFDQLFIDMMVPHHQGGVEMARIASARTERPQIKALAEAIIRSQEAEIREMKSWRKTWFGSEVTPAMGTPMSYVVASHSEMPDMDKMHDISGMMGMPEAIEALRTATPFDLAFLDAMIPHHQGAVIMAQSAAEKSAHEEVKALAVVILREQIKEIEEMQMWRNAWYPDAPLMATAR